MGLLIVISAAFFGLLLWLMHGWMTGHALVASKNGKWEIVSHGCWMLLSLGKPHKPTTEPCLSPETPFLRHPRLLQHLNHFPAVHLQLLLRKSVRFV
jgi:hypothetical protein